MRWARLALLAVALGLGCSKARSPAGPPPLPESVSWTYKDHTLPRIVSEEEFSVSAVPGQGTRELKFIIPFFEDPRGRHVRFLDGNFYSFHDEWYWFTLLAGKRVPGDSVDPQEDHHFQNPSSATHWASRQTQLPLGLRMVEGRLYADRFYDLALTERPRVYGLGSVFHIPRRALPTSTEEFWAFKVEYIDVLREKDLVTYFEVLRKTLPTRVAEQLVFVARSPQQHELIKKLKSQEHPLSQYLRDYSDLVTPGAVELYSEGLTAGKLRIVEESELLSLRSTEEEILVLPQVPDELPAAAGLITAVPQTPLSHINLLAKNRRIPNLYLGDALADVRLRLFAKDEMPVVLFAKGATFVIEALDQKTYQLWRQLTRSEPRNVPAPRLAEVPYVIDLVRGDFEKVNQLRPIIGGKAAGYLALLAGRAEVPVPALALSVRPFLEHLESLGPSVREALVDGSFEESEVVRMFALEGAESLVRRFGEKDGQFQINSLLKKHRGSALGELMQRGGLQKMIRDKPIRPEVMRFITDRLRSRFSSLSAMQGLRFRSSSNVEDLEGFNGAGLYASNSGFLDAASLPLEKEKSRTVEAALKKTWASFFSFAAFEERRRSGIDPRTGGMGVLVHPRFDNALEESNGVFTLLVNTGRYRQPTEPAYSLTINAQAGAESVTNARPGVTPEVVVLESFNGKTFTTRVVSRSNQSSAPVLSEEDQQHLFTQAVAVGVAWLEQENRDLPMGQRRTGVLLDFEFRKMAAGWPRLRRGTVRRDAEVLLKQVRSLEPVAPPLAEEVLAVSIPREILGRARRIVRTTCLGQSARVRLWRVMTDPLGERAFAFARGGFLASVEISPRKPSSWIHAPRTFSHLDFEHGGGPAISAPREQGGGASRERLNEEASISWTVSMDNPQSAGFSRISKAGGRWTISRGSTALLKEVVECTDEMLLDHPDRLLRQALEAASRGEP